MTNKKKGARIVRGREHNSPFLDDFVAKGSAFAAGENKKLLYVLPDHALGIVLSLFVFGSPKPCLTKSLPKSI